MVGKTLIEIRTELGFTSARAFYQDYLCRKSSLEFNYSYYMKIEGSRVLPSAHMVSAIAETLDPDHQQTLIISFCQTLFPTHSAIFNSSKPSGRRRRAAELRVPNQQDVTLIKPRWLTPAQVAAVAKSKVHYFVFLILTLARSPISTLELANILNSADLKRPLDDLSALKLASLSGDRVTCIAKELKFPKADSPAIQGYYEAIDIWNLEFAKEMKFNQSIDKMFVRRVSSRYVPLLAMHAQLMFDSLKAFDEVDQSYNDDVVMVNCSISLGQLPG